MNKHKQTQIDAILYIYIYICIYIYIYIILFFVWLGGFWLWAVAGLAAVFPGFGSQFVGYPTTIPPAAILPPPARLPLVVSADQFPREVIRAAAGSVRWTGGGSLVAAITPTSQ